MAKKPSKKKNVDNFIGLRLPVESINRLDHLASLQNKSRGTIAKEGLQVWLDRDVYTKTKNVIIIPKPILKELLPLASKDMLERIAEETAIAVGDIMRFIIAKPIEEDTYQDYFTELNKYFGAQGVMWFSSFQFQAINGNGKYTLRCLHDLGDNFSEFFALMFKKLMDLYFNLKPIKETEEISSLVVNLDFKPE